MSKGVTLLRSIGKSGLIRNALFVGGIFSASEFTQETIIGVEKYDFVKIARFGVFGLCCSGPFNYTWFRVLEFALPGYARKTVLKKLVADQLFAAPLITAGFFVVMDFLERKEDVFAEAKKKTIPTWMAGLVFWPPAQFINFMFVPLHYRVVYVGIVAYLWANFLCYMRRKKDVNFLSIK
ncbi:mpv17-like protein [Ptychodera flava]|uniref:mpv17-like protein n=1 Tax=Ptychodera flava TaxID=63121 RepID=UPI003969D159